MKKNNSKKLICLALACMVAVAFSVFPADYSYAANGLTQSELEGSLDDVEDQQEAVENELADVVSSIKSLNTNIDYITSRIEETAEEIQDTEDDIARKQIEIQSQETNLNERLVVMYKNGSIGFVDVLLGSGSISEFISNVEMIKIIYENDVEVLKTLQEEQKELEEIMVQLEEKKEVLAEQKEELAEKEEKLNAQKKILEKKEDELKAEADALTNQIKAMIDANSKYEGGTFLWPCPSSHYITSSFGTRLHPVLKVWKTHTGTDIGANYGADILAAAYGKVILAQYYGGYGNCVIIDHGGGVVTLYGHASSLLVSVGQVVERGTVIAKVGSTGTSTGNHLHFEVRINGEYVDPMGYF